MQGWKKLKTQHTSSRAEPHVISPSSRLFYMYTVRVDERTRASTIPWCIVGTAEYQLARPELNHSEGLSGPLYPGVQITEEPDIALANTFTERPWMWYKGIRFKHLKRVKSQRSSFFCGNVHEKSWKLSLHDTTFKFKISEQAQSSYAGRGTHHFSGDTKLKRCKVHPLWGSHELGAPGLKGCSICQVMVKRSIKIAEIAENNITRPASHILTLEVQDHWNNSPQFWMVNTYFFDGLWTSRDWNIQVC